MRTTRARTVTLLAALALLTAACGGSDTAASPSEPAVNDAGEEVSPGAATGEPATATGTISLEDQESDGSTVTVAEVMIDGAPGWIAIHTDQDGAPGPVIGVAEIEEGMSSEVAVELDEPLTETTDVWPMLHVDDGQLGEYEFPAVEGADLPVTDGDMPVMEQITVTVQ